MRSNVSIVAIKGEAHFSIRENLSVVQPKIGPFPTTPRPCKQEPPVGAVNYLPITQLHLFLSVLIIFPGKRCQPLRSSVRYFLSFYLLVLGRETLTPRGFKTLVLHAAPVFKGLLAARRRIREVIQRVFDNRTLTTRASNRPCRHLHISTMVSHGNRLSTFSSISSPIATRIAGQQSTQVSTTTLLNTLHTIYTSSHAYPLDASTSLVVNTWLSAIDSGVNGRAGATVDDALARRVWEHARRRAEDGCVVLG